MLDHVSMEPWRAGTRGRAWAIDYENARKTYGAGKQDAGLGGWIVEAQWAHPIWHSYMIALVHLRPMDDGRETKLYRADATHEFWVYALDPDKPREPAIKGEIFPAILNPCNFGAQLAEASDQSAVTRIEGAIELILSGELNPDTDAERQWEALFGNHMIKPEWRATRG